MSQKDPIEDLYEKFRDSIVDRGLKRYENGAVAERGDGMWVVDGDQSLNDTRSGYTVTYSTEDEKYNCECYDNQYGLSRERSVCSHVMATIIHRRMQSVRESVMGSDDADPGDEDEASESHCEKLLDELWPHPDYRNGQQEVMIDCLETLFKEGKDTYILCAPTGFGKCVTPDTLVDTGDGLKRMGELGPDGSVRSFDSDEMSFTTKETREKFDLGVQDTISIETSSGYTVEGTPEHRVKVLNEDGEVAWRRLENVSEGDTVPVNIQKNESGEVRSVKKPVSVEEMAEGYSNRLPESVDIDEDVARFLGWFVGDGSIDGGTIEVTCEEGREEAVSDVVREAGFGFDINISDYSGKQAVDIRVSSKELAGLVEELCYVDGGKRVPSEVLSSPPSVRSAFLNGLFGADGTVNNTHLSYSTSREDLSEDVQQLLRSLGIVSQRREKTGTYKDEEYTSWRVVVSGEDVDTFDSEVGEFYSAAKTGYESLVGGERDTNSKTIPNVQGLIQSVWDDFVETDHGLDLHRKSGLPKVIDSYRHDSAGPRKPSHEKVHEILDFMGVESEEADQLRGLADLPVYYDEVETVEPGESRVYDINVEDTHNYVSNGIVSHNSPVGYTLAYAAGLLTRASGDTFEEQCETALSRAKKDFATESVGYYVTPQNILLNQLDADYGDLSTFGMVKGRSHYSCSECTGSCSDGPCRFDDDLNCTSYTPAKNSAFESAVTNTNFSMFMVHPEVERRGSLVVDEAHMMPEYVLGQVEVELREDRLANENLELPEYEDFEDCVDWAWETAGVLQTTIDQLAHDLKLQSAGGSAPDKDQVRRYERLERLKNKLDRLVEDYRTHEEPWVVEYDDSFYDDWKEEYVDKVTFRPVTPYRFMDGLVFNNGQKSIISSATPPKASQLGLDPESVHVEEVPSTFPIENRPCYVDPVGKMSSNYRDDNLPDLLDYIEEVAYGNTLIHAHTYKFAQNIHDGLAERVGEKAVSLQDGDRREGSLNDWKNSDAQFFVSVNMYDGVDLPDELCRTNIVCVCPFPYLGDPQVQKRKEVEGDEFFNWQTAMRIQQAYGRSTRSEEDWSNTHIVDSNFKWFFRQHEEECFFDWFQEAVEFA